MNGIVAIVRWFVGLDYHQSGVQICVMDAEGNVLVNRKCQNEWSTIVAAVGGTGLVVQAAVEACCGAANLAKELAVVLNTTRILPFRESVFTLVSKETRNDF